MVGVISRKQIVSPIKPEDSLSNDATADDMPLLNVCVTCFHTPAGCASENLTHKRLPEHEYGNH